MSNFRTALKPVHFPFQINHSDSTICVGSCFAVHIGERLEKYKFPTLTNALGILYNPISIAIQLNRALEIKKIEAAELFEYQGLWHHFQFHSEFSGLDKEEVLKKMNKKLETTHHFLKKSKTLIITFGTAWRFSTIDNSQVVANCHKLPAKHFEKKLLSVEDCTTKLFDFFEKLKVENPGINIILTVSPVRHTREGLIENQRSKSTLLLSCAKLSKGLDYVHYFPSWEIMMDDLRDYRFYESDMIHPNEVAIDYIWSYFQNGLFSEDTKTLNSELEKVIQASQHRPFQQSSTAHQIFLQKQLEQISNLKERFPFINLENESVLLENQLES
ncbi:MAG: GSCFA domain-containing protein [Saprospiraceae bacterium]